MAKNVTLRLSEDDIGQILDGLRCRAEAWRKTASYLRTGDSGDELFVIEECSDADEASGLAFRYEAIIRTIAEQLRRGGGEGLAAIHVRWVANTAVIVTAKGSAD